MYRRLLQGGADLCQMTNSEGDGWSVLNRIHEFTGQTGITEYALPDDFKSFIVDTAWQKDKYWRMRGSLNGKQWEAIRNRQSTISYNVFRIIRGSGLPGQINGSPAANKVLKFVIEPAPADGGALVNEYVSDAWWINAEGTQFKRTPTADTDESLFGDTMHEYDVAWRWKAANGLNYGADIATFERFRDIAFSQDTANMPIRLGRDRIYANPDESDVEWCP